MSHATRPVTTHTRRRFLTQCLGGLALAPVIASAQGSAAKLRVIRFQPAKLQVHPDYKVEMWVVLEGPSYKSRFVASNGIIDIHASALTKWANPESLPEIMVYWTKRDKAGQQFDTVPAKQTLQRNVVDNHNNVTVFSYWAKPTLQPDGVFNIEFGNLKTRSS